MNAIALGGLSGHRRLEKDVKLRLRNESYHRDDGPGEDPSLLAGQMGDDIDPAAESGLQVRGAVQKFKEPFREGAGCRARSDRVA